MSPVDLSTVPTPQLSQLKNQLTQDLSHLTTSFAQLRGAQTKFRECVASIRDGILGKKEGLFGGFFLFAPNLISLISFFPPSTCDDEAGFMDEFIYEYSLDSRK